MLKDRALLLSSLILSLGIIVGCYLLASKLNPVVKEIPNNPVVHDSILLDIEEASEFLGISTEELKTVMNFEKQMLQQSDSYDGMMLPIIVIEKEIYFERTKLLLWAQESATLHKEYGRD